MMQSRWIQGEGWRHICGMRNITSLLKMSKVPVEHARYTNPIDSWVFKTMTPLGICLHYIHKNTLESKSGFVFFF